MLQWEANTLILSFRHSILYYSIIVIYSYLATILIKLRHSKQHANQWQCHHIQLCYDHQGASIWILYISNIQGTRKYPDERVLVLSTRILKCCTRTLVFGTQIDPKKEYSDTIT